MNNEEVYVGEMLVSTKGGLYKLARVFSTGRVCIGCQNLTGADVRKVREELVKKAGRARVRKLSTGYNVQRETLSGVKYVVLCEYYFRPWELSRALDTYDAILRNWTERNGVKKDKAKRKK